MEIISHGFNMHKGFIIVVFCLMWLCFVSYCSVSAIALGYCNDVVRTTFHTKCQMCLQNGDFGCPMGTFKLTNGPGKSDCRFDMLIGKYPAHKISMRGCRHKCLREKQIPKCCSGYWGPKCDKCPGRIGVCNGNGDCNDAIDGTGECVCEERFSGYACERCANETLYGYNCENVCECVHGKCSSGIHGDGSCDCKSGYRGEKCDEWIDECTSKQCPPNSRCRDLYGYVMCSCDIGYNRTMDGTCEEVNACEQSTPCDENGICTPTGPNTYNCTCAEGYKGDGFQCDPINLCQSNNTGCVSNSSRCIYTGPGQMECQCLDGFEGYRDGYGCELIDVCVFNKSKCDVNAICKTTGPRQFSCTCKDGYGGNGTKCYPNIVERIKELNENEPEIQNTLNKALQLIEVIYNRELREHGPFTVFLPNDRGFRTVYWNKNGFEDFLNNTDYAKQILRQHIVVGQLTLMDLHRNDVFYTLQGVPAQMNLKKRRNLYVNYRYKLHGSSNRASVIKGNIMAGNGIIHIIGRALTNRPNIMGNKQKTVYDLMKTEEKFNMTVELIDAAGLRPVFSASNITVFAARNEAWSSLPGGTLEYLLLPEARDTLKSLLNSMVFEEMIEVADLINRDRIRSRSKTEVSVRVTGVGKILLNDKSFLSQTDIPAKSGFIHLTNNVLLPADIYDLLPNRCKNIQTLKIQGPCGACHRKLECLEKTDIPLTEISTNCTYQLKLGNRRTMEFPGCARICNRTTNVSGCCPGFHGAYCRACPGGFINPCSGNGQCADYGSCVCDKGYTDRDCSRCADRKKFGPNCTQSCTCLHGICDNRIRGTGKCIKGSCHNYSLSITDDCDMELKLCPLGIRLCHSYSMCVIVNETTGDQGCICKKGYEEYGEDKCAEIDPCSKNDRGGCHLQAKCTKTGPGTNECDCEDSWVGDGKYCYRGSHCDDHIDCHDQGVCQRTGGNSKTMCVCREHFHGNGTWCVPNDQCDWDMGGCDLRANCTPTGPGTNNCTCWEGYGGDGRTCIPTISKLIEEHPNLTILADFIRNIPDEDNLLLSMDDKFTLFAPTDNAMRILQRRVNDDYWKKKDTILNFLRFHMLIGLNDVKKLTDLVRLYGKFETLYDGFYIHMYNDNETLYLSGRSTGKYRTKVIEKDMIAVNGYVHVIDRALETFFTPDESPMLQDFFVKYPQYSVFGELLTTKGVMEDLEEMNEYTLFVPTNSMISKFYNSSTVTRKFLQFYILPSMRFLESFDDKERVDTVLGSTNKLIIMFERGKIFVNEAEITKPDMLTDGGVVHEINGILSPLLHRCDFTNVSREFGPCVPCKMNYYPCPETYTKPPRPQQIIDRCVFKVLYGRTIQMHEGCQIQCERAETKRQCCDGYYGRYCRECPGGPEFPCNNNGNCSDGLDGSGMCMCNPGYTGEACEFCIDGETILPCSQTCRYNNGGCSYNAECIENARKTTCLCNLGYVGDGNSCDKPCDIKNGGCHINATCQFDGEKINCTCPSTMTGNGFECTVQSGSIQTDLSKSSIPGGIIAGIIFGVLAFLGILVVTALLIRWKLKSTGNLNLWDRVRRDSDTSFAKLQPSEDESSVTQPLSPVDINFDNPLYNVRDEF